MSARRVWWAVSATPNLLALRSNSHSPAVVRSDEPANTPRLRRGETDGESGNKSPQTPSEGAAWLYPRVLVPNPTRSTCWQASLSRRPPGRPQARQHSGHGSPRPGAGWGPRSYAQSWGALGTRQRALSGLACPSQVQHRLSARHTASLHCKRGAEGPLPPPSEGSVAGLTGTQNASPRETQSSRCRKRLRLQGERQRRCGKRSAAAHAP